MDPTETAQTALEALEEFLTARPSADPVLAAVARRLAAEIDTTTGGAVAVLSKEYQATMARLRDDADAANPFDRLCAEMGDAP